MIEIQYLESTENLKKNILASQRWLPNAGQAEAIAACLRQGRLFYEAAKRAPLEIRPLELYYGTSAYAKALILSTNRRLALNTLHQSHGISDTSPHNARLQDLKVQIGKRGTFQEFNDCVAKLNRIHPMALDNTRLEYSYPCAESTKMTGITISLKDIFSRLPTLEKLYRATFDERENIDHLQIVGSGEGSSWTVQCSPPTWERTPDGLLACTEDCRNRMPFLNRWALAEVSSSSITFRNAERPSDELDPKYIQWTKWGCVRHHPFEVRFKDIESSLRHLIASPGPVPGCYYVQPIGGNVFAFQSLQFLALHLLSSLVRYRPATWMHALSRSANNGRAADDAMLALIEEFMNSVYSTIPKYVAKVIRPEASI